MILSDREKKIAIGVGAGAAALLLYQFMLMPFLDKRESMVENTTRVKEELKQADVLFARERELKKVWADITAGGLKVDIGDAQSQLTNAVEEWARDAGVALPTLKSDGAKKDGNFLVISYHATVTGSTRQIAKLAWALETAPVPVRINDMRITPQKEGTDQLQAEISVSTISMLPDAEKPDVKPSPAPAANGGQS